MRCACEGGIYDDQRIQEIPCNSASKTETEKAALALAGAAKPSGTVDERLGGAED